MRLLASQAFLQARRRRARLRRALSRTPAAVHYFHQVDDPYSLLAVQKLDRLRATYGLPFQVHLVSPPQAAYRGDVDRFDAWARRDAQSIADAYGTSLNIEAEPGAAELRAANDALAAALPRDDFADRAMAIGSALWKGSPPPGASEDLERADGFAAVAAGDALRKRLGHYLGAMFYFDGEWFWGIDRIRSLERRLRAEGFGAAGAALCVPEPTPPDTTGADARTVTLEYFPSLRSPYTAVGHAAVVDLVERSGVTLRLRPVMPMMMRGVPAPLAKQRYIITDAAREARERGVPFGRIVDPFGEPVKRAFALFPAAAELGRGLDFVTAYLAAAWADGVDITGEPGLQHVVERAGLGWTELTNRARGGDWQRLLDDNVEAMLGAGLWGVPSFRVSGGNDPEPFACWGQDRIWRVEQEIARRMDIH